MVTIREYRTTDKDDVMELIRRNTPEYFAAEEEIDLSDYLDREIESYYAVSYTHLTLPTKLEV